MSATATYVDHAAEIYAADGPTGRFVRVLAGEVRDYGSNVLFAGSASACTAFCRHTLAKATPHRLVPTSWEAAGEIAGAGVTWQCVTA